MTIQRSGTVVVLALAALSAALLGCSGSDSGGHDAGTACPDPPDGEAWPDVFCTGLYENRDATQHAASATPYTPGMVFWSDGAEKHRYFYLPADSQIDTSDMDAWKFPIGTKAWKEFNVNGALAETRLLWKRDASGWTEGTYIWNADLTEAPLNTSAGATLLPGDYEIPAVKTCDKCHGGGADHLLGLEAIATAVDTAEGVTLAKLVADGSLTHPPTTSHVALPEDDTGKAAEALGYMHINCGVACHSTRGLSGFTQLHMRLRAEEFFTPGAPKEPVSATDTYQTGIDQDVILATYAQAFPGTMLITPGSHELSLAYLVAHLRGQHQMPPIVSHMVDEAGTQRLADWFDALPPNTPPP